MDQLFDEYWNDPQSDDALRVWADALTEAGDPRGPFVQASLEGNADQIAKLKKKFGGKLVGPARPFLREWSFGPQGLVDKARTEANKVAEGIDEIGRIHPNLILTVTSLKKKKDVVALSGVSLGSVFWVDFNQITGSHGGSQMKDATLEALIPTLAKVQNLSLSCRGYRDECFSPAGLAALGNAVECLEYLAINYADAGSGTYADETRESLAPIEAYIDTILSNPGFRGLKAIAFYQAPADAFSSLPNLGGVATEWDDIPADVESLAALKQGH